MELGCVTCEHLNTCIDALREVSPYCGAYNHEEAKIPLVYAVDFDGTLCTDNYPYAGEPNEKLIKGLIAERARGVKLILWTCREGEPLDLAVEWCKAQGLEFDAVNENLPELKELWGNDTRKIGATLYIDDKAVRV